MKEITAYKAEDGEIFESEKDAVDHETLQKLLSYFDDNPARDYLGGNETLEYFDEHRERIIEFLSMSEKIRRSVR